MSLSEGLDADAISLTIREVMVWGGGWGGGGGPISFPKPGFEPRNVSISSPVLAT